ncbi:uncharacterized protein TRIREDRAFT_110751 [Trichoderma reesei QM6a]|jgi:hypothetical protein|uniref:Predicted protein n=2 Tax=Hypocrea jecorina TaxID=51453 RepID=G0RSU7_HYPJQ|nr:uncharacterized protein TRIREDRAFT_110751 [Trichoderma reesei QM6a]EGR45745.1 predicted protein [Trichoderma reesei QM6a]ETS01857.1 hypothetical protein M419DRAFT_8816 [Trichoderma reesei RUT C-30]
MEPPAWYCRLVNLPQDHEIEEHDFDDDISELREGEEESVNPDAFSDGDSSHRCDCPSSDILECECDDDDDDDDAAPEEEMDDGAESERSYQGSDADYYYELKEQRIQRKIDLRDLREEQERERRLHRELESEKEQEVREAYEAMLKEQKKGDAPRPRLASLSKAIFHLFSVDHIDYCYCYDLYLGTRYVEFYCLDEKGQTRIPDNTNVKIQGHVYLSDRTDCDFLPFAQPKRAGIKKRQFPTRGQDHDEPVFQFISNKYLIMTVKSDSKMVSGDIEELGATEVPKELKFFGICMEKEERELYLERRSERFRRR